MNFGRRTTFQLAFLIMGLIIWAYGQRVNDATIRLAGIAFFAVGFLMRFFRGSDTRHRHDEHDAEQTEQP